MSLTVRFSRGGASVYSFPVTPHVEPSSHYQFDSAEPPNLIYEDKTWVLVGKLYGTETTCFAAWDALETVLKNAASYPDAVELLSGASVIEKISAAGGYDLFRIEQIDSPRSDLQWRGEMLFTIRVSGRKRFPVGGLIVLSYTDRYSYSDGGLLTRTVSGEIETVPGTSAAAQARLQGIGLPDATFAYLTNSGDTPGGVDVDQLNKADTKARFACTIQQSGAALPAGVGPSFSKLVETEIANGQTVTTTTAAASGVGAEAAVRGANPGNAFASRVGVDNFRRIARAVYSSRVLDQSLIATRSFTVRGGGAPIAYSRRTGGRTPARHVLALAEVEIVERFSTQVMGNTPRIDEFKLPAALEGIDEDTNERAFDPWPTRQPSASGQTDVWTLNFRRVYRAPDLSLVADAIEKARAKDLVKGDSNPQTLIEGSSGGAGGSDPFSFFGIQSAASGFLTIGGGAP